MARKKKSSPIGDIYELVALLPWWLGVILAIASYLLLHSYASQGIAPVAGAAPVPLSHTVGKALAAVFQYILPIVCLAGAVASAWEKVRRRKLLDTVTSNPTASVLNDMTWQEFEVLVGEGFRLKGYQVKELGGNGPDGGVDLVLTMGGETTFVQCKQWKAFKVGVDVARQLYGVMASRGAAAGFVVTSGTFTPDAIEFAKDRNVNLMDGKQLLALLHTAQQHRAREITPVAHTSAPGATQTPTPACPRCGSTMIKREAKRGANAGNGFWGCSTYPKCKGTTSV